MKLVISKEDAAQRQIDIAIELLFLNKDPVSVHTLAMAAFSILKDLAEGRGQYQTLVKATEKIRKDKLPLFWRLLKEPSNFFKHADNDPETTKEFSDVVNDGWIMLGISLYQELGYPLTQHMKGYNRWFMVFHPEFLQNSRLKNVIQGVTKMFSESAGPLSRNEQLAFGLEALRQEGFVI